MTIDNLHKMERMGRDDYAMPSVLPIIDGADFINDDDDDLDETNDGSGISRRRPAGRSTTADKNSDSDTRCSTSLASI